MADFTQKWCIVSFVQKVSDGTEFSREDWPLHVTLIPTFAVSNNAETLIEMLTMVFAGQKSFRLKATEEVVWAGPVTLLDKTPEVVGLHYKILDKLKTLDVIFNEPSYIGDNYKPHCSHQKEDSLQLGDEVQIKSVSLIDMFPGGDGLQRKMIKTVAFNQD